MILVVSSLRPCVRCSIPKPPEAFYPHKGCRSGRDTTCKECHRSRSMAWRQAHPTYRSPAEKTVEYRSLRQRTRQQWNQAHPVAVGLHARRWAEKHPEAKRAHRILNNAIRAGIVQRPTHCEKCERVRRVDGHHEDYTQPLVIRWLCRTCHRNVGAVEAEISPMEVEDVDDVDDLQRAV